MGFAEIFFTEGATIEVMHSMKGHDCPDEPIYHRPSAQWFCRTCEWRYEITENQCFLCGMDEDQGPIHDLRHAFGESFITFKNPMTGIEHSLHSSCSIYETISEALGLNSAPDDDEGWAAE